ncbi:radical SAM protein [Candidatus Omnitrophota bacterium]
MFGALADKIEKNYIPITGSIELTWRCNLSCRFCYQYQDSFEELTLDETKVILDELAYLGCLFLSFTGGEPLLHKDFWDIAKYAATKQFALTLQSNGTLINQDHAQRIKELNFFDVHISLLGAKRETHDWLTQSAGSFDKVINSLELLRRQKIKVMLKTTVVKHNFSELKEIGKIAKRFGCKQVVSPIISTKANADKGPLEFRMDDSQIKDFYIAAFKKARKYKDDYKSHAGEGMVNCRCGRTGFCINPRGEIYPCVGLPVSAGSLREESFKKIWDNSAFIRSIRQAGTDDLPLCSQCALLSLCMRCKGMAYMEDGSILAPSQEACRIAHIVKEVM